MLRDRYRQFHFHKRNLPPSTKRNLPSDIPPPWQNDYYHYKNQLQSMTAKNGQIAEMVKQYRFNPSVFNLKQLQIILHAHCRKIDQLDYWITHFPFSRQNKTQTYMEINLTKHMKQCLFAQIKTIFQFKQQITDITNEANNRELSFNTFKQSMNVSYGSLNNSMGAKNDRNQTIRDVTARIQNLNLVLRRMGQMVVQQGGLVDRIDEHLVQGHNSVGKGKDRLKQRMQKYCEGRINKVIMGFYITDIILILILVLKNL